MNYTHIRKNSTVQILGLNVGGQFWFPSVAIGQQLLLVVQQLLVRLSRVFKVRALKMRELIFKNFQKSTHLNNGVNWTSLLAQTTIDTLCHVNVITNSPTASVGSCLCFNCDSLKKESNESQIKFRAYLSRADRFAQLASNTAFFTIRITTQSMFTTEASTQWSLLKWIINRGRFHEDVAKHNAEALKIRMVSVKVEMYTSNQLGEHNTLIGFVQIALPTSIGCWSLADIA
jgi:hypothetical protein